MDEEKTRICVLFDFYGELLSPAVADSVDLYYNDDLSLSEVAENTGISRQGVRDNLRRGIELLEHYEEKLGLYEKFRKNEQTVVNIRAELKNLPDDAACRINALLDLLNY